ncbi:MAG: two-component system response regulator [Deltaproteobacteria bacterium]|nr:MAG: two-component system response regulator [Deltaproteobacteria bacterium]PIE73653.1 MAG: two-component system response regulator [Deltaproteobacteria bacterium]
MNSNKKILLVDDEQEFREITGKFLLRRNMQSLEAENCMAGLDLLAGRDNEIDVIVMDVSMPGMDGISCMAEIKKSWPEKEIIILTGHASLQFSINGMKQGAFDYCMKPVDYTELLEKILLARESSFRND